MIARIQVHQKTIWMLGATLMARIVPWAARGV